VYKPVVKNKLPPKRPINDAWVNQSTKIYSPVIEKEKKTSTTYLGFSYIDEIKKLKI
jgi:hypothetical protein